MKMIIQTCKFIIYCLKICFRVSKSYTLLRFVFGLIGTFENFTITVFTSLIISELTSGVDHLSLRSIVSLVGIFFAYVLFGVFSQISVYEEELFQQKLDIFLKERIIRKSVCMDIVHFDNPSFYDDFEMSIEAYQYINLMVQSVVNLVSAGMALITAFVIVEKYNWIIGVTLIVFLLPYAIFDNEFVDRVFNVKKDSVINERKANYFFHLSTNREHALEIRLYDLAEFIIRKFRFFSKKVLEERKKIKKKIIVVLGICENIPQCLISVFTLFVIIDIINGKESVGAFTLYMGMFIELKEQMIFFVGTITDVKECQVHIDFFRKFVEGFKTKEGKGKKGIDEIQKIEFRHVYFKYPKTEKEILKDVSFVVNKGETIGIVGLNGAGKSTIVKLLMRYYDVDDGEIFVNNHPIIVYDLKKYRSKISACFQSVNAYGFTLRDNILMATGFREKGDDSEILSVLRACGAKDVIERMPDGLDSYITKYFAENGMELSGGQYQKLALARTYYRNSSLLILDEPSAALDPEAEKTIFDLTEMLSQNNNGITIFVTHRLGNVKQVTKVLLLEDGEVIGFEPHEVLIKKSERYRYLYDLQASKFR